MRTVFTATIKIRNGNPYIPVDAPRAATIKEGWRKPLPVLFRINGLPTKAWRVNMMPARARNLAKVLHVLSGEPGRFMARAWKNGV